MKGAHVALVRGCELVSVDGCYYLRIPDEAFTYQTTRAYRWKELGSFESFPEAEKAAREVLNGGKH